MEQVLPQDVFPTPAPPIQESSPQKLSKIPTKLILGIVAALVLLVVGIQIGKNIASEPPQDVDKPTSTPIKTDTGIVKKYQNQEYGFSFNYPTDFTLKEIQNQFIANQLYIDIGNSMDSFSLDVSVLDKSSSKTYLGYRVEAEVNINYTDWEILKSPPEGYCDMGECSGKQTVYQTIKGTVRYAFVFNDSNLITSGFQKNIVNSLVFDSNVFDGTLCQKDKNQIETLITKFEDYQKQKNAAAVLEMITPATGEKEIEKYKQLSDNSPTSLYQSRETDFDLEDFSIKEISDKSPNMCEVWVQETRVYNNGFISSDSIGPFDATFILQRQNNEWKVDYYTTSGFFKYEGWINYRQEN